MSDKVSKNDLCPCGSGKKYKKCCFLTAVIDYSQQIQTIRRIESKMIKKIDQFCHKNLNGNLFNHAWMSFLGWTEIEDDGDPLELLEAGHMFDVWRQFHWRPEGALDDFDNDASNINNIAKHYLASRPICLDEREFLLAAIEAPYCYYQIISVIENQSMILKNLFTEQTTRVIETTASRPENVGDMLFTTIIKYKNLHFLFGTGCYAFDGRGLVEIIDFKQSVIENIGPWSIPLIREYEPELLDLYWGFRDQLFNPDTPLMDRIEALEFEVPSIKGPLNTIASQNDNVTHLTDLPHFSANISATDSPQVITLVDKIQFKQWQQWLNNPIDALQGSTPIECAKTRSGQQSLQQLLTTLTFENPEHQQWVYQQLSLELPES